MSIHNVSARAKSALRHLNSIKPVDGWSYDTYHGANTNKLLIILKRRNIPLTSVGFEDIILDAQSGAVVGILQSSSNSTSRNKQALVLVEKDGSVCRSKQYIEVDGLQTSYTTTSSSDMLTSEQNKQLLQVGGAIVFLTIFLNIFGDVIQVLLFGAAVFLIPFLSAAILTCPTIESFDAKKELKRAFRGEYLPENHPDKPKGWFEQTKARFAASVATELASGLGYEVKHMPILGAVIFTTVSLNQTSMECYWVGAFNKWYFIMQRKINEETSS